MFTGTGDHTVAINVAFQPRLPVSLSAYSYPTLRKKSLQIGDTVRQSFAAALVYWPLRLRALSASLHLLHLLSHHIPLFHLLLEPMHFLVQPQCPKSGLERKDSSVQSPASNVPQHHPANAPVTQHVPHHRVYEDAAHRGPEDNAPSLDY